MTNFTIINPFDNRMKKKESQARLITNEHDDSVSDSFFEESNEELFDTTIKKPHKK